MGGNIYIQSYLCTRIQRHMQLDTTARTTPYEFVTHKNQTIERIWYSYISGSKDQKMYHISHSKYVETSGSKDQDMPGIHRLC